MKHSGVAVVGLACRYADAPSPSELWGNALAGRRAFRRIPRERLCLEDYWSADRRSEDATYGSWAAVIEGYEFDRRRFRVSAETYRSVDLSHWLALDVASEALADAGFRDGAGLPLDRTRVLVGNTLTGEFSRAAALRLRWPYVRRVIDATLEEAGEPPDRRDELLARAATLFKAPFPPVDGETLAGGLSNTIAGRICNHFDLRGGGYTLDGACASSLLAVAQACSALVDGEIDAAIAGGVDLSLDPFELVGFAKAGALASEEMRVFDAAPTGFWPGEGCGFAVLMREADAGAQGRRTYAVVRGWGISSDGRGGMTRPELKGQLLALDRAYARAGFDVGTVAFFEGHGTGTAIGDAIELAALSSARRRAGHTRPPAAVGTIKANVGHTKAAAGIAGFVKASLAVHERVVPPTVGCREPHELVSGPDAVLRVLDFPEPWPQGPVRAGVSAMGFGGIDVHVALEGMTDARDSQLSATDRHLARARQDAELFLIGGRSSEALAAQLDSLVRLAPTVSLSELTDLAVHLQQHASGRARAAVVASTPLELERLLRRAHEAAHAHRPLFDAAAGVFVDFRENEARIGFLFTGQGAPVRTRGDAWSRRFQQVDDLYRDAVWSEDHRPESTVLAQPAIVRASCAALRVLSHLNIRAVVGIGHSLGELTALHWSGALDEDQTIGLAGKRGELMASLAEGPGAMAGLTAAREIVCGLLSGTRLVLAAHNAPDRYAVAGPRDDIDDLLVRAGQQGISATRLPVSQAFHSPLMRPVVPALRATLEQVPVRAPQRRVVSTVTGAPIGADDDIRDILGRQICEPVRLVEALGSAGDVDLFIEVGPGHSVAALGSLCTTVPALSVDACHSSLRPLLVTVGAAFALGSAVAAPALAADRFAKSFDLDRPRRFFVNPCELAPERRAERALRTPPAPAPASSTADAIGAGQITDACLLLRTLVSRRTELPLEAILPESRFLSDLHLNSITVAEILAEATGALATAALTAPTDYANAPLIEAARALETLQSAAPSQRGALPAGLDTWVRAFEVCEEESALPRQLGGGGGGEWRVVASADHPLRTGLLARLADRTAGPGTVVCMDAGPNPPFALLLEAAKVELARTRPGRFVVVQQEPGFSGFARTLFLESGVLDVSVVTLDFSSTKAIDQVAAEAHAAAGFIEARYDAAGRRYTPLARALRLDTDEHPVELSPQDVLLVTGGGKGIAAECALALSRSTGVRLGLMGRSTPDEDATLASNLERMRAHGALVRYMAADVTDAAAVHRAVTSLRAQLGEITAVLHAAARNEPSLIAALDGERITETLAPKIDGARHVLASVDPARLKAFISFGSVIARTGLPGEAHYAMANDRLRELTTSLSHELNGCRCLTIEWSVWAAAGMGERLGRMDALAREGVTAVDIPGGIALFERLLKARLPGPSVIGAGRLGVRSTLTLANAELPFLRFLESPHVHVPSIELVADSDLSLQNDPYLADHRLDGQLLFPAVMGLEAIAQAAMALAGTTRRPDFEDVEFARPIIVPQDGTLTVRAAALLDPDGRVRIALRSSSSDFQMDNFRAVCTWPEPAAEPRGGAPDCAATEIPDVNPAQDLYGPLLFQSGRFARVRSYRTLFATRCCADISAGTSRWFGDHFPDRLVLGDPGARDAALHSVQACIPQLRLVPARIGRLRILKPLSGPCRVSATQVAESGNEFIWNLVISDAAGSIVEMWDNVHLRGIAELPLKATRGPLLGPYIERRLPALGHRSSPRVVMRSNGAAPDAGSEEILRELLDESASVWRRADGKPDSGTEAGISVAHTATLTLAVAAAGVVGCDLEKVSNRSSEVWSDLLGSDRASLADLISRERHEVRAAGATRVWAAVESLKKAGAPPGAALLFRRALDDGWVTLQAGQYAVSTWVTAPDGQAQVALAVATRDSDARV